MSKVHELKLRTEYFKDVEEGRKTFEIRKNDRDYKVGDTLILKEWYPGDIDYLDGIKTPAFYTGKKIVKRVTYILEGGQYGLEKGYCILGIGEVIKKGHITDEEIDSFGKFTDEQKEIIKEQYSKHKQGFFPNPMCALY